MFRTMAAALMVATCGTTALADEMPKVVIQSKQIRQDVRLTYVRARHWQDKVQIDNRNEFPWEQCVVTLKADRDYRILVDLKPGVSTFRVDDFADGSSRRFDSVAYKPNGFVIRCNSPMRAMTVID
jgi:hypothetical protein